MKDHNRIPMYHRAITNWVNEHIRIHGDQPYVTWLDYIDKHAHCIHARVISPNLFPEIVFDSPTHLTHFLMQYSHGQI